MCFTIRKTYYYTPEYKRVQLPNVLPQVKIYDFVLQNEIFHLNLQVLVVHTVSLCRLHQAES
jgi:hypothetical protein